MNTICHNKPKSAIVSFSGFCELEPRRFPPVPIAQGIRPAQRGYLSLPRPLYTHHVADLALEIVAQYARKIVDVRELFSDNDDWLRRCGRILRGCDALFILVYPDLSLAAGGHAEAAYAHALGIPVYAITWRLDHEPRLRLGGTIETLRDWHWWRAAIYRPPRKAKRTADARERPEAPSEEPAHADAGETASQQLESPVSRIRQRPARAQRIAWRAQHRRRVLRTGEAA